MNADYVFLCGAIWQEAGKELLTATGSADLDIRTLAWEILAKGIGGLRKSVADQAGKEDCGDSRYGLA